MAGADVNQELSILFPERYDLKLGGELLTVTPFKAGSLPRLIPALSKLAGVLAAIDWKKVGFKKSETEDHQGNITGTTLEITPETLQAISQICEEGGETFKELMALAVGKTKEWFDQLDLDEGIELAVMVLWVNQDFFEKRLMAVFDKLSRVKAGLPK